MSEWLKEHAWKACVGFPYRGFESRPLRFELIIEEDKFILARKDSNPKEVWGKAFPA